MIDVISVYQDSARDNSNKNENGYFPYEMFNRISRRAELRLIDYLSGDVEGVRPPIHDSNQKNRDWLSPFIETYKGNVEGGKIDRPANYYGYDNMYVLGVYDKTANCETQQEDDDAGCNTQITLLPRQSFYNRCNTFITGLKPSFEKPIAKLVGKRFEFMPRDLGSIALEYIRYPKFASIVSKTDPVYNDVIADPDKSQNYEWDEFARELLVWFITDTFAIHTRDQALKQQNSITSKLVRDIK